MSIHFNPIWVLLGFAWLAFSIWTMRKLHYLRTSSDDGITYKHGVDRFGVSAWALTTIAAALLCREINSSRPLWYYGVTLGFTLLPVALWAGYIWGKAMSAIFPSRPTK